MKNTFCFLIRLTSDFLYYLKASITDLECWNNQRNLGRGVLEAAQGGGWLPEAGFGGAYGSFKPHNMRLGGFLGFNCSQQAVKPKIP
jgi:hypothetical protein